MLSFTNYVSKSSILNRFLSSLFYFDYDESIKVSEYLSERNLISKAKRSLRIKRNAKIYENRKKKNKVLIERLKRGKNSNKADRKVGILKRHGTLYKKDIDEKDYWFVKLKKERLEYHKTMNSLKKEYLGDIEDKCPDYEEPMSYEDEEAMYESLDRYSKERLKEDDKELYDDIYGDDEEDNWIFSDGDGEDDY